MTLRAKFCVIGTGAGGGMLAYQLARAGEDVLVLTAGSFPSSTVFTNELSPQQQGDFEIRRETTFPVQPETNIVHPLLLRGGHASLEEPPPSDFHHYQVMHANGLQNLWNGVCLRNSADDFANRNGYSDDCLWGVSYEDMAPHYGAAERLGLVVGEKDGLDQFPDGEFLPPKGMRDIDRAFLRSNKAMRGRHLAFFSNRKAIDLREDSAQRCVACGCCARGCRSSSVFKFSSHLYPQIGGRSNFRLIQNARITGIQAAREAQAPAQITAIDERDGSTLAVEAQVVILCTGAIESARLMLNSFSRERRGMDQCGRFLQDVPAVTIGSSLLRAWFRSVPADRGYGDHLLVGGRLGARQERFPYLGQLWSDFMKVPYHLAELQMLPSWLRSFVAKQVYRTTAVLILFGPAVPRRANRVELDEARDPFGQRKARIDYTRAAQEGVFSAQLERLGRKLLRNAGGFVATPMAKKPGDGIHYAGTCRMGPSPDKGVVDSDLKFYGANNVYICDGGVIPQLSEKHPALTIMALAHRLGDHLVKRYS